jgi:cell filamentation protein
VISGSLKRKGKRPSISSSKGWPSQSGSWGYWVYWVVGFIESWTSQKTKKGRNRDREKLSGGMIKRYMKKIADRYDASGLVEAQFEPGSRRRVLKNLLGIRRKREMDRLEGVEQLRALRDLIKIYGKSHQFTAADICRIRRIWLKGIYSWAGKYRRVNLTKDNLTFAAASQIARLMEDLERGLFAISPLARSIVLRRQSKPLPSFTPNWY